MKTMTFAQKMKYGSVAVALAASNVAHAALDSAVVTELGTSKTDILALGAIVFGIAVALKLYKWLKAAL